VVDYREKFASFTTYVKKFVLVGGSGSKMSNKRMVSVVDEWGRM
jgi:hypothetical protein